ncbi:Hypothetical predicted protein [Olea europaea subsp. europaea]|uniref:Uncharacterized protein n=1 Tax=Olea europaea subsp. europaea TaxID=158383 RepID=A0A8S0TDX3_OLEEU|nr:Hypothetical predicted protein [Olea europaea subsp. europaea]
MIGVGVVDCLVLVDALECISDRICRHIMWFSQIYGNRSVGLLQSSLKALGATECLDFFGGSLDYVAIVCNDIQEALSGTMWTHRGGKGKEKVEPSGGERKMRLVISRNEGPPPPPKRQTTIEKSFEKPIEAEPISALKSMKPEEVAEDEGGGPAEELATRLCHKYLTEQYSNYAETCNAVDKMKTGLAMQARSQGFFVNVQMDMKRLQKVHTEFEQNVSEAVADAQKLKNEVTAVEEALEASKLKHVELKSIVEQLTSANKDLTAKVYLCQSKVNALTKGAENYDNLQKIALTALEEANKEKAELKAKVEGLATEVTDLKQQLEEAGAMAVEEDEFIPAEPSNPTDEEVPGGKDVA